MPRLSLSRSSMVLLTVAASALLALPALAESQARIVRLSDVQGSVQIDKNTGLGFESAFLNLPITQGTQVRTHDRGRAEIEFEDGSTLRLAPNTTVSFSTLGLSDAGKRISVVDLVDGTAYVNWLGKSDQFSLNFSREKIALDHPAHFRVETSPQTAELAVFKGDIEVEGPAGKVTVEKKRTAHFDGSDDGKYTVAKNIEEAPLDSWDKDASEYHQQYAKNNSSSPYQYGMSDLNYYGAYSNVPGYGMMWQPYFTGVGWDPFMDGAWSFYPGYGYMFASAYPWGWMPYRYGSWISVPGMGWMWQPGGWNTWNTVPQFAGTMPVNFHPLAPPTAGTVRPVVVGRTGVSTQPVSNMVLRAGSAGFGIPRGSIENLHQLNHQVAKSGSAEVRPAPQFATTSPRVASMNSPVYSGNAASSRSSQQSAPTHSGNMSSGHASGGGGGSHH